MFGRVGVDRVQHAGVIGAAIAVRETIVQRRVAGEGHGLQIARQADQHRPAGLGVDAGHGHAVRPESDAILAGVTAHQQDVVAALFRDLVAPAGEDGRGQLMLRGGHGRHRDEATKDGEGHRQAER